MHQFVLLFPTNWLLSVPGQSHSYLMICSPTLLLLFLLLLVGPNLASLPCLPRHFPAGTVCVCNATYCDQLDPPPTAFLADKALVYTSSASGKRFNLSVVDLLPDESNQTNTGQFDATVELDVNILFQEILGFGGAFTDAVGFNLNLLSARTRKNLLKSYFDRFYGIGYTLGRVPMASTDFSTRVYSYCDHDQDFALKQFALASEDIKWKIPLIRQANWLSGHRLQLIATPWSAPNWMKETNRMQGGGRLKGPTMGKYWTSWAHYFIRFFEEYRKRGVRFWGLTLQNEPSAGLLKSYSFQAMYMSAAMQRDFLRDLLGPRLRNHSASAQIKVMVNDDNRIFLPSYPDKILRDAGASKFVDGIAVHWYWNFLFGPGRLERTHERHPDKFILATEACNGWHPHFTRKYGVLLGDWWRAEKYAKDIMDNLEHWAVGWMDWNLCLDERGGPSWVPKRADSPVVVNGTGDEFYKQPMFYAMGHFSKFIRPGSVRIGSLLKKHGFDLKGLAATAVLDRRRGQVVLVLQNRDAQRDYRLRVNWPGRGSRQWLTLRMEAQSLSTVLFQI